MRAPSPRSRVIGRARGERAEGPRGTRTGKETGRGTGTERHGERGGEGEERGERGGRGAEQRERDGLSLAELTRPNRQNCQEYLRSLSESITPEALLRLPISTFIVVIGCGDPALIDMYVEATGCRFPIYTDPTRALFDEMGMAKTLALGAKPAYQRKSLARSIVDSIGQGLRSVPAGLALKSGDSRQVGGEFLFEPLDVVTPISTPREDPASLPLVVTILPAICPLTSWSQDQMRRKGSVLGVV